MNILRLVAIEIAGMVCKQNTHLYQTNYDNEWFSEEAILRPPAEQRIAVMKL